MAVVRDIGRLGSPVVRTGDSMVASSIPDRVCVIGVRTQKQRCKKDTQQLPIRLIIEVQLTDFHIAVYCTERLIIFIVVNVNCLLTHSRYSLGCFRRL